MDIKSIKSDYDRDGVVCVKQFFSPQLVAELKERLEKFHREIVPTMAVGDRTFEPDGKTVRNLWRLNLYDSYFHELAHQPKTLELIATLVNGTPAFSAVETFNKPARVGTGVPPHQDNAYFCQSPPDMLTLWIAIDPATEANGAVQYLCGSHHDGLLPHRPSGVRGNSMGLDAPPAYERYKNFTALLDRGDAVIHHCNTIHFSAPNRTDQSRLGMLMVYHGAHTATDPELKKRYDHALSLMATA